MFLSCLNNCVCDRLVACNIKPFYFLSGFVNQLQF